MLVVVGRLQLPGVTAIEEPTLPDSVLTTVQIILIVIGFRESFLPIKLQYIYLIIHILPLGPGLGYICKSLTRFRYL